MRRLINKLFPDPRVKEYSEIIREQADTIARLNRDVIEMEAEIDYRDGLDRKPIGGGSVQA